MAGPTQPTPPRRRTAAPRPQAATEHTAPVEGRRRRTSRSDATTPVSPPAPREPGGEAQEAGAGWMAGLGGILRGSGGVLGQISGIDGAARSLERLANSAERATTMLDRVDREVGLDRLAGALDLLERLTVAAEQMRASMVEVQRDVRAIEERVGDLQASAASPIQPTSIRRRPTRREAPGK